MFFPPQPSCARRELKLHLSSLVQEKTRKLVYMGRVNEKESFGEVSVLLQVPFTCTVITGEGVEMAVIEDQDLFGKYLNLFLKFSTVTPFDLLTFGPEWTYFADTRGH